MSDKQLSIVNVDDEIPIQPRQPQNLQGLMRFAMEATKSEDAPADSEFKPIDPERREFLENTLRSLTVDVIEMLKNYISILNNHKSSDGSDQVICVNALENIIEHVDNLDTANDFYKIGGFKILPICLSSTFSEVRSLGCELIAELSQNNPFCQDKLLNEFNILTDVLKLLSDSENVSVKAMYAISCIVRSYEPAIEKLMDCGGLNDIIKAIGALENANGVSDKLRTKGSFLLRALCVGHDRVRAELLNLNAVEQISSVLMISTESYEHLLSTLLALISAEDICEHIQQNKKLRFDKIGQQAIKRARKPELGLKKTLESSIKEKSNKPEFQEVILYCTYLMTILFSSGGESADR